MRKATTLKGLSLAAGIVLLVSGALAALGALAPSGAQAASSVPALDHVVWIVDENHDYSGSMGIIGNSNAPYFNHTMVPEGALATNYFAVTHPSLPNYLALVGASTFGQTQDCTAPGATDGPCRFSTSQPSIFERVDEAGKSWKEYAESEVTNCDPSNEDVNGNHPYYPRHAPPPYFTALSDCSTADAASNYSHLASDFSTTSAANTPAFSFVTPNGCHDMHDPASNCGTSNKVSAGDAWFQANVPTILNSYAFTHQHSLLAITWDEDSDDTGGDGNKVVTLFIGYNVLGGSTDGTKYTHYSLLHTTEQALGLTTINSNDAGATLMAGMFQGSQPSNPPTVGSFSPTSGEPGTVVSVTGTHFTGASKVAFHGASATFSVVSDTSLSATVPNDATTGPISVTNADGTGTSSASFTVTQPVQPPSVSGFSPTSGPPGTAVSISGSNFTGASNVTLNGTQMAFTVTSDTAISATVPDGATSGPIAVTTDAGTGTSSSSFTVTSGGPPPTNNNVVADSFVRADQALWGTSTNGDGTANTAWAGDVSTDSTYASISSDVGKYQYPGALNSSRFGYLGSSQSGAVDVYGSVAFASVTNGDVFRLIADATLDGKTHYAVKLDTTNSVFRVEKDVNGSVILLQSVSFTYVKNTRYDVRLDVSGGTQTVAARIWVDGTVEPSTWAVSAADSALVSGYVGVAFMWNATPSGTGDINENNFAAAVGGNLAVPADPPGSNPPPPVCPGLMVSGTQIVDCTGAPTVLRGFSQGPTPLNDQNGWNNGSRPSADKLSQGTLAAMSSSYNANTVRIPVSAYICEADGTNCDVNGPYQTELRTDVENARAAGLYVIIVPFDDAKSGDTAHATTGEIWPEDMTFYADAAPQYASDTGVLWDVLNEPNYSSDAAWANGDHGASPELYGMNDAVAALRADGVTTPIIIEQPGGVTSGVVCKTAGGVNVEQQAAWTSAEVSDISDSNIVFSDHRYHSVGVGDATAWNCIMGAALGVKPYYIGEWGALPHSNVSFQCQGLTSANADSQVNAFMAWAVTADGNGGAVSWTAWDFEPVNVIQDNYVSWTPTVMNTGTWTCDDGSTAGNAAGDGADIQNWLLSNNG